MKSIRKLTHLITRLISIIRYSWLSFLGVHIHWTAKVAWSVEFQTQGGRIDIGRKTQLHRGVILKADGGFITIKSNCTVNPYSIIYGFGGIVINDGVHIAAHSILISANHIFDRTDLPIFKQGASGRGIIIDKDVWLGAEVRVLDGVTISQGCVIGAGAVVNKSTVPYGIYVGVPIKQIGARKIL
jgi:acetyltransferase-like isoleucine patch superfamily enzyme